MTNPSSTAGQFSTATPVVNDPSVVEPVGTLRGARVEVDVRRATRAVVGICVVGLAVVSAILFAAGADKNAQITELRVRGVSVEVTVSRCIGLLGGSGSNSAGYACNGTYSLNGHHYSEAIPGDTLYSPGTTLKAVASPRDPQLFSTASAVASEHASWRVYILPSVLLILLVLIVAGVVAVGVRPAKSPRGRGLRTRS